MINKFYQIKKYPNYYTNGYDVYGVIKAHLVHFDYRNGSKYPKVQLYYNEKHTAISVRTIRNIETTDKYIIYDLPDLTGYEQVKDFPDYLINRKGQIFSKKNMCLLKPILSKTMRYYQVNLFKDNKMYPIAIHKLVARTFIPNPDNKPTIDHINRDRLDNRVENLRWATTAEQNKNRDPKTNERARLGSLKSCAQKVYIVKNGYVDIYPSMRHCADIICRTNLYRQKKKYGNLFIYHDICFWLP